MPKKKKSPIAEIRSLSQPKPNKPVLNMFNGLDDDDDKLSEEKEAWVQEQLAKNMTVDEFNQAFQGMHSLKATEGKLVKYNDGNLEKHEESLLELWLDGKRVPEMTVKFDPENPVIPREIFAEMTWEW